MQVKLLNNGGYIELGVDLKDTIIEAHQNGFGAWGITIADLVVAGANVTSLQGMSVAYFKDCDIEVVDNG